MAINDCKSTCQYTNMQMNTLYTSSGDTTVSGPTDPVWLTQTLVDRIAALESVALSE